MFLKRKWILQLFLIGGQTPISPQIAGMVDSCAIKALEKKWKWVLTFKIIIYCHFISRNEKNKEKSI